MKYEVIREIKNPCSGNQMRDIFFDEIETDSPVEWVRSMEPNAEEILVEEVQGGMIFRVFSHGLETVYTVT